jgi:Probable Zinc-ribbon domain
MSSGLLSDLHPELASQADGWDPATVTCGSNQKLAWICAVDSDHKWAAVVANRVKGNGCPYCAGKLPIIGTNDLLTTHPVLAAQALFDATTVKATSGKNLPWKCPAFSDHKWLATVINRTTKKSGCPYCANQKLLVGFNDLKTKFPKVAKEALFDATSVVYGSTRVMEWQCNQGHPVWKNSVSNRTRFAQSCPYCVGNLPIVGETDLATTHPDMAAEAHMWDPSTVKAQSHQRKKWACKKLGHVWTAPVYSRTAGGGCPVCSHRQVLVGFNDLGTTHPELALEADFDVTTITAGSHKKVAWICRRDDTHRWTAVMRSRAANGNGCPICAGQKILVGFNDLATTHPAVASEAVGWDPTTVTRGTMKVYPWKCDQGHVWQAGVSTRVKGHGCSVCTNQTVQVGVNDLKTRFPDIAAQAIDFDTSTVGTGSSVVLSWQCEKNHVWETTVRARTTGSGCPACAVTGYDPSLEGWLYLIEHPDRRMLKLGISNYPNRRLAVHRRNGFTLIWDRYGPLEGERAKLIEQSALRFLRDRGIQRVEEYGTFDGYTEAWLKDEFPVTTIMDLLMRAQIMGFGPTGG